MLLCAGLDARAAAIVMRSVKNVSRNGRTVMVTIHQPSIEIFEGFDALFLLQRGGRVSHFSFIICIYRSPNLQWHLQWHLSTDTISLLLQLPVAPLGIGPSLALIVPATSLIISTVHHVIRLAGRTIIVSPCHQVG